MVRAMQHNDGFRAMDTEVDVIVEAATPAPAAMLAVRLLFEQQEQRFSRFRPASQLSRLNAGEAVEDALVATACGLALESFEMTDGLFNPMVLPALAEAGYGKTFGEVHGGRPRGQDTPDLRACVAIDGQRVQVSGGQLDLGGIVKGWTVDLAVEQVGAAYPGFFLNAGGDLRCSGAEAGQDGWLVGVDDGAGGMAWEGALRGALATSTTRKRRWTTAAGGEAHHLIDPRTGLPAVSQFVQVSCWAAEAWRAEVWAKAVLIGGGVMGEMAAAAGVRSLALDAGGAKTWFGA